MKTYYKRPNPEPYGRHATTVSVAEAMERLLKSYQLEQVFKEQKVIRNWATIMGETIAKRTGKCFAKNQALYIEILSAPLKSEMAMSKSRILAHVNTFLAEPYFREIIIL